MQFDDGEHERALFVSERVPMGSNHLQAVVAVNGLPTWVDFVG
jgi:hypothetical protein